VKISFVVLVYFVVYFFPVFDDHHEEHEGHEEFKKPMSHNRLCNRLKSLFLNHSQQSQSRTTWFFDTPFPIGNKVL